MKQTENFVSGSNKLSCVFTVPNEQEIKAGLIFVHAAEGTRLGPHRMYVEIAERLKCCGVISLRFDMRGCGDSEGEPAGSDIDPDIEDLLSAISFMSSKYKVPKILLFGISRGARVSITTLAEHGLPIDGAVLLSTPFASSMVAAKNFTNRLKEYLYKLFNYTYLKKLLLGKANPKQIVRTMIFALSSTRRYRRNHDGFKTTCPLLFIYGSKDPLATDSSSYYENICNMYKIRFKMIEIKNSNHSYFHYRWKEQIMNITEQWLNENILGDIDGSML